MMSKISGPPRYPSWQPPAAITSGVTTGSSTTEPLVPSRPIYPLPGPSPLPLSHFPPGVPPQCLRVPIPLPRFSFHTYNNRHHLHFAPPTPVSSPTVSQLSTPGAHDAHIPCNGATPPTGTTTASPLHFGLPVPADIRRPLPLVYSFSTADLDNVLYGYVRAATESPTGLKCALSGLRILESDHVRKMVSCLPPSCDNDLKSETGQPIDVERAHSLPACEKLASQMQLNARTVKLPEGIAITQTMIGGVPHYSVFSHTAMIPTGTRFGPFTGRIIHPSEIKRTHDTNFMWEIFHDGKLSHFVDGRNGPSNWLCFVNCARHAQEQNLAAVQSGDVIYYESCKDILRGAELLVWYGDSYRQFMGIPVSLKGTSGERRQDKATTLQKEEGYKCDRCGKVFSYKDYRDKHLKYTRCVDKGDRKFRCHLCTRSFEKRDRLRIHILHVHQKHRPHKCGVCGKSFSQSSSLNKHMRVHSGERPYKCVYCSKAFTASSILRTHIRQHSGEKPFKCKHCGKAFASHAAHDSHVRRTHGKDRPCVCPVCGKSFSQNYELKFHMNIHPDKLLEGNEFGRQFENAVARDYHVTIHTLKTVDTAPSHLNIQTTP